MLFLRSPFPPAGTTSTSDTATEFTTDDVLFRRAAAALVLDDDDGAPLPPSPSPSESLFASNRAFFSVRGVFPTALRRAVGGLGLGPRLLTPLADAAGDVARLCGRGTGPGRPSSPPDATNARTCTKYSQNTGGIQK